MKDLFYRAIKLKKEFATDDYLHLPLEVAALNAELDELLKVDYSHVSGGYRNKDGKGAERFAIIRSVIDTAIKNGQSVFAALCRIAECCPMITRVVTKLIVTSIYIINLFFIDK